MRFELTNSNDALNDFFEHMEQFFSEQKLPEEMFFPLRLALEELITNIIKYGYDDTCRHVIHVDIASREEPPVGVAVRIQDDGHPFDPLTEARKTEIAENLEDQEIGGLGVFLVKKVARDLIYRREKDCNIMNFWIGENAL